MWKVVELLSDVVDHTNNNYGLADIIGDTVAADDVAYLYSYLSRLERTWITFSKKTGRTEKDR